MPERDDLLQSSEPSRDWAERHFGLSWKRVVFIASIVIVVGVYIGNLLFGSNSLDALIQLQEYESSLKSEVNRLKKENAQMQREYFDLKEIRNQE